MSRQGCKTYSIAGRRGGIDASDLIAFVDAIQRATQERRAVSFRAACGTRVIVSPRLAEANIPDALRYLHDCLHGRIAALTLVSG